VTVVRSLCMACHEQGTTRLLLTRIPFFKDVIIMAFSCEECGHRSSEVQAAEVQERGCRFEVTCASALDLNRQLLKGDKASATVRELELEIPAGTQSGTFTTVEGLLQQAEEALTSSQALRRALSPADADSVEAFCARLAAVRRGEAFPFTLVLDDPSGNSFVENPHAPRKDPRMRVRQYVRTPEQDQALGLSLGNAQEGGGGMESLGLEEGGGGSGGGGGSSSEHEPLAGQRRHHRRRRCRCSTAQKTHMQLSNTAKRSVHYPDPN
jgi:zinc finger protein